jgi:hypothetical protein
MQGKDAPIDLAKKDYKVRKANIDHTLYEFVRILDQKGIDKDQ